MVMLQREIALKYNQRKTRNQIFNQINKLHK